MRITMVKKRLANGDACQKCVQTEEMLRNRGLWSRVDEVVWAVEGEPESPGMRLGRVHSVANAPFFVVSDGDGTETVYTSALKLVRDHLTETGPVSEHPRVDVDAATVALVGQGPETVVRWGLERFGAELFIAFSGAEDVALIHMAAATGLPFSVFTLDTGRLHPETYEFIDRVRAHFGIDISVMSPQAETLQPFVRAKGLFSFYDDGHKECCGIRKVEPLKRVLAGARAWMTGQRKDQSPDTRQDVPVIHNDPNFSGLDGASLCKLNPMANLSLTEVWQYIRDNEIPHNSLHDRGFISIGCQPCTRATAPGEHERAGRWWWEESTQRECGLHK